MNRFVRHNLKLAVDSATMRLADAGVPSPAHDAIALAAHLLAVEPAEVHRLMILGWGDAPEGYDDLVSERARRIPLQHLTGVAYFRGLELAVGPGVFVPRPETEAMVDLAMNHLERLAGEPVVVDLCSGSGAIAFGVKDECPLARVYAVEVSADAMAWAELNRQRLALAVEFVLADARTALTELDGTVDVVLSNPPYIPPGQVPLDPEVRDHDPRIALYGTDPDGLGIAKQVAARAARLLRPGGLFVMEHADSQRRSALAALAATGDWADLADVDDLAGRPRCLLARRAGIPAPDPVDTSLPAPALVEEPLAYPVSPEPQDPASGPLAPVVPLFDGRRRPRPAASKEQGP